MKRSSAGRIGVALATAVAVAGIVVTSRESAAGRAPAPASALTIHETLRQSLSVRPRGANAGVSVRERRHLRARLAVLLPNLDAAAIDGNTRVGLRLGDWTFERPVSFDPTWRPGRTRATFRMPAGGARRGRGTVVRASWGGSVLKMTVISSGQTPTADGVVDAPAGPVSAVVDAAARLGPEHVHLRGDASGTVLRTVRTVLESPVDLARVAIVAHADVATDGSDTTSPVVTITSPAPVSAPPSSGTVLVEGTIRDDRTIESVSWTLDDGVATSVAFDVDPSSGFLDDLRAGFSFSVQPPSGVHALRVHARDTVGNVGVARIDFSMAPEGRVLRTLKWGAACIDEQQRAQAWGDGAKPPAIAPGLADVRVAVGNIALLGDGTVSTLHGDPSGVSSSTAPFAIEGLDDVADVAQCSANSASYALRSDGTVWAWGDNSSGQLGDGTTTASYPPIQVNGLPPVVAISAGAMHAIALDRDGAVWTWGGFLARTDETQRLPRQVPRVANAVRISASQFDRYVTSAAVLTDGTLWMWGDETSGQLGSSITVRDRPAFQVPGVTGARSVSLGYNHVLLLLDDGTVLARGGPTSQVWGYWGELGDGTMTPHLDFAPVPELSDVVQVSAGAHTSHVLLQDGTLRAWGENTYGSLGDGTNTHRYAPVVVQLSP